MIKIAAFVPNKQDATSWYRAYGPLKELENHHNVKIIYLNKYEWSEIKGVDTVFLQRPILLEHIKIIMKCKMMNKKIIVDYDDYLLDIPAHNPFLAKIEKIHKLTKQDLIYNIKQILNLADQVWVPTKGLKDEFLPYNQNTIIIPNAHCDYTFPVKNKITKPSQNVVLWRGTQSHSQDLRRYKDVIIKLIQTFTNHKFIFMGTNPTFITNGMKNCEYYKATSDIIDYFYFLHNLNPKILLVPLIEDTFNNCKSNIASLESVYTSTIPVAPLMHEWTNFSMQYKNEDEFFKLVSGLLTEPENIKKLNDIFWKNTVMFRLLSEINKIRFKNLK